MHSLKKLALVAIAVTPFSAFAVSSYVSSFRSTYSNVPNATTIASCSLCHPGGNTGQFNAYANDFAAAGHNFRQIEGLDSDNDGATNIEEINAGTFPGDRNSTPAPTAAPRIAVSSTTLAFGTITVGSTGTQTTIVSNSGNADLTVSLARCSTTSSEFAVSPASFTVAAGGRQTVTASYTPGAAGTDSGCFAITDNDASTSAISINVSGTGQAATPPPSALLDVDISRFTVARRLDLSRGAVAAPAVSVVNAGTVAGTATVAVVSADGLYSASQTVTLTPGATARVKLPEFNPANVGGGNYTFTATVTDADPDTDEATVLVKVIP